MSNDIESKEGQALPDCVLDESLEFVTVTFPTAPGIAIKLRASEVDELLARVGYYRSVMDPDIAADCVPEKDSSAVSNPGWHAEVDNLSDEVRFSLRDPRFGWLHYVLPKGEAEKLAKLLQHQTSTTPQQDLDGHIAKIAVAQGE